MPAILLVLSATQMISLALLVVLLFLGFKLAETSWSYKISKPHMWEEAVKNGIISKELKSLERFYRDKVRFYNFWMQVERLKTDQVPGAFAEVGVYKGETARFIHRMDSTRKFYLFDTFSGFSEYDLKFESPENESVKAVDFSDTSLEDVLKLVGGNSNVQAVAGYFPESTYGLPDQTFALVHLDADLYQPTLEGLRYFYPRLSKGGVIIIHDYNHNWEGVQRAVNEFAMTIPERVSELTDWQGSVMIIKNRI